MRALAAIVVTAAVVILLARFETEPPRTFNPNSALGPVKTPRALARPIAAPPPRRSGEGTRSFLGPAMTTPFSAIQVRAFFVIGLAALLAGLAAWTLERTRPGRALQAIASDPDGARFVGIPVEGLVAAAFGLVGGVAALAAIAAAPSAPFFAPRPTQRDAASAADSVVRTSSMARLRSGCWVVRETAIGRSP
jgi:branched-subunit amino acid ABC-type transport system permease component